MTVPTTELGGVVGAVGFVLAAGVASAGFVALVAPCSVGALARADLTAGLAASLSARFSGLALDGAGVGVTATAGAAFLVLGVFAACGGVRLASTGAALGDFAAFAKTRGAGAGATAGAAFCTATGATSAVFLTALRGAGFFAVVGAAAACFSGTGLRALLDGAFALAAGALAGVACAFKLLEAVDFAVFFVVNL